MSDSDNSVELHSDDDFNESQSSWDSSGETKQFSMKTRTLRKIAVALRKISDEPILKQIFSTEGKFSPDNIQVIVEGVGKLAYPISSDCAMKLIKMSSLAKYGLGEETLLNRSVRDTHMIPAHKLKVEIGNWTELLQEIQQGLGLTENCTLQAHLYNMLVYEEGQFFDIHQDSEKLENMVATMVVILPSVHIGGNLVIQHMLERYTFSSETIRADLIKYAAFYADCLHRVEKIKQGYRIVLTYNIVLNATFEPTISVNMPLLESVQAFVNRMATDKSMEKLVYLLNFSYTKSGLFWKNLKGSDRKAARALTGVGKKLDLVLNIALVDVQEHWNDYEGDLDNLESFETTIEFMKDINDQILPVHKFKACSAEVCWTKKNLNAYNTDRQQTGNAGCTEDRWFKRAAIVLWPRVDHHRFMFRYCSDQAMKNLNSLLAAPGNKHVVINIVKSLSVDCFKTNESFIGIFITVAIYVNDDKEALEIVSRLSEKIFLVEHIHLFFKLLSTYGLSWCLQLIENSKISQKFSEELVKFASRWANLGGDLELARKIINQQLINLPATGVSLDILSIMLQAFSILKNESGFNQIIDLLKNKSDKPEKLANVLLANEKSITHEYLPLLNSFMEHVILKVRAEIQELKNTASISENIWNIKCKLSCRCGPCAKTELFLNGPDKVLGMHLNKRERWHARTILEQFHLPITATTMREYRKSKLYFEIKKNEDVIMAPRRRLTHLSEILEKLNAKDNPPSRKRAGASATEVTTSKQSIH